MAGYGLRIFDQHAALLEASGISPEVARERGYMSVDHKGQLEAHGFTRGQRNVPGLLIPVRGTDGDVRLHQYRPDKPRVIDGKPVKYETPAGRSVVLDVPQKAAGQLLDPSVPLYVTEGSRKADAAVSAGLCCIALLGVDGWMRDGHKLPDWRDVALKDRDVLVAFDSDVMTKASVAGALWRLTEWLAHRGATVRHVILPPGDDGTKTGLDDFLGAGHQAAELEALARNPEPGMLQPDGPDEAIRPPLGLVIRSLADIAAEVRARPPRRHLFLPFWPAGDYGVLSAEDKAGKSLAMGDAAVSCAAGLPWLGEFACCSPGPVLWFVGEGGDAKALRRIHAIARSKGLTEAEADELPIRLCFRVPHLTSEGHLALIAVEVENTPPALMIIDPLYLAARGAKGSDLFSMGAVLEGVQHVAQQAGSSLIAAHHWKKGGDGSGHDRSSGVGPGAWGRFLISVAVLSRSADPLTGRSSVRLGWSFRGDETPDADFGFVREVWADDPADLNSPLNYTIERTEESGPGGGDELRPSWQRVLAVLLDAGIGLDTKQIGDHIAKDGKGQPLKLRTIQDALKNLEKKGLVTTDPAFAGFWCVVADRKTGDAR